MTRRDFILCSSGALAAQAIARPIRSNLGGRDDKPNGAEPIGPYDAQVEYLESTGTQFITTKINPSGATSWRAEIVCLPRNISGHMSLIGCWYNTLGRESVGISNRVWSQTSISVIYSDYTTVVADETGQYFNGTKGNSNNIAGGILFLFNRYNITTQYPWKGIIASCTIAVNGIMVRDFIPVRFTNDLGATEGAMYDRVSGDLFRNIGTGSFGIGPDVK